MPVKNRFAELLPEITAWRRDFHEIPNCNTRCIAPPERSPICCAASASMRSPKASAAPASSA
jgi:hypothetical protein